MPFEKSLHYFGCTWRVQSDDQTIGFSFHS